jgi:SAM-dependent methyltransferase
MTTRSIEQEQRRYKSFIHTEPIGGIHNMQPVSVKKLMDYIGRTNIQGADVLDVGCGQGYLLSHFLNLGARRVIGTDITNEILESIPKRAYSVYPTQEVLLRKESFMDETPMNINVSIITQFIGIRDVVMHLLDLFTQNRNVKIIAFMRPNTGKPEIEEKIEEVRDTLLNRYTLSRSDFKIKLSGSGEQRHVIVLKKVSIIHDLTQHDSNGSRNVIDLTFLSSDSEDDDDASVTTLGSVYKGKTKKTGLPQKTTKSGGKKTFKRKRTWKH